MGRPTVNAAGFKNLQRIRFQSPHVPPRSSIIRTLLLRSPLQQRINYRATTVLSGMDDLDKCGQHSRGRPHLQIRVSFSGARSSRSHLEFKSEDRRGLGERGREKRAPECTRILSLPPTDLLLSLFGRRDQAVEAEECGTRKFGCAIACRLRRKELQAN